jgi:hypothetical protein
MGRERAAQAAVLGGGGAALLVAAVEPAHLSVWVSTRY